jgi:hypothetical protein
MSEKRIRIMVVSLLLPSLFGCLRMGKAPPIPTVAHLSLSPSLVQHVLSLDPEFLSEREVAEVLSRCPAPRILVFDGSLPIISMESFAKFLIRMGYPEGRVRHPSTGSLSYSSHRNSEKMAGMIAWYYENEGMRPMLVGQSQGGMFSIKIVHEFAGTFREKLPVWNPYTERAEDRHTIVDPLTGRQQPVVGLKLSYASAIATGKLMRVLLGQWDMLSQLRRIPDSVEEFTGFHIPYDLMSGTLFGVSQRDYYVPVGSAAVRNVVLPSESSHLTVPLMEELAGDRSARGWIDRYRPSSLPPTVEKAFYRDKKNILLAADLWYSIRKHWCIEVKRWILAGKHDQGAVGPWPVN